MANLNRYIFSFLPLLALTTSSFLFSSPASAAKVLEEVIVTATKREQAVNDIAVAVSAYGGEELRQSGIRDVGQVVQVNPSLSFSSTESSGGGSMSIRGVGTLGTDPGLEPAVGVFIDGVYRNRAGVAIDELGEIERVEVLRGPQGTLFGRNTSAGLVQVVTKSANIEEDEGFFELQLGNYNLRRLSFAANKVLIEDKLAGRIDAIGTQRDGYLEEINDGPDVNDRERYIVRGQLKWEPSDTVSARFIIDYSDRDEICCGAPSSSKGRGADVIDGLSGAGALGGGEQGLDNDTDPYDRRVATSNGRETGDQTENWGISGEVSWDLNDSVQAVSVTAYREYELTLTGDIDFSGADIYQYGTNGVRSQKFETITQELRFQGAWDHGSWLVGLFYANETLSGEFSPGYGRDTNNYARAYYNAAVGGLSAARSYDDAVDNNAFINGQGINDKGNQDGESIAIFTQNDFDLADNLVLTAGLRWTQDKKEIDLKTRNNFVYVPGGGGGLGGNPCIGAVQQQTANGGFYSAALGGGTPNATTDAQGAAIAAQIVQLVCGIGGITNPFLNVGSLSTVEYSSDRKDEEVTGTLKLAYTLEDDALLWLNVARGYKSGGFNQSRLGLNAATATANGNQLDFDAEIADSYEAGYKTYYLDRTVAFNATLFYSEFQDFQLGQFYGATLTTSSVDKVEVQGIELETTWQATDNLRISGGINYIDNFYPSGSNIDTLSPGAPSRAGKRRATDWTATASLVYTRPLNETLMGSAYLNARYVGDGNTNASLAPQFERGDYTVFNGRVGISDMALTWTVEFWARNLTDTEYSPIQFNPPGVQGTVTLGGRVADFIGEPRMFGITGRKYF